MFKGKSTKEEQLYTKHYAENWKIQHHTAHKISEGPKRSEMVSSPCCISDTGRLTLVTNLVISHERRNDWNAISTSGTHLVKDCLVQNMSSEETWPEFTPFQWYSCCSVFSLTCSFLVTILSFRLLILLGIILVLFFRFASSDYHFGIF